MEMRVVIVEEFASLREMLANLLAGEGKYRVVGETGSGLEAMDLCRRQSPHLVITELALRELSGGEVLRRLREEQPATRALVYSGSYEYELLVGALHARPHGFVHKSETLGMLRGALQVLAAGGTYIAPFGTILQREALVTESAALSTREREVVQLVAESRSSREIAARLGIAVKTVENHRARVMEKLQLHDVAAITRYAVRRGLISVG